jgi:hypothetical protein
VGRIGQGAGREGTKKMKGASFEGKKKTKGKKKTTGKERRSE